MAILYTNVTESGMRVVDPVTDQIIEWVLTRFHLKDLIGVNIEVKNDRTATSLISDTNGHVNMANDWLRVTVDTHFNPMSQVWEDHPDYNTLSAGTAARYSSMYRPIIADPTAGFYIREMSTQFSMTLNFRFEFLSYDIAADVMTSIFAMDIGDQVNHVQDVVVSYPITKAVLETIFLVYSCKQDYGKAGKSMWDYFQDHVTSDYEIDARRDDLLIPSRALNAETVIAFKRIQMDCRAKLSCEMDKPEPIMEGNLPSAYAVEFSYAIQMGRPNVLQITLPPVVDQTALPDRIFDRPEQEFVSFLSGALQDESFDQVLKRLKYGKGADYLLARFPYYDDWNVPHRSQIVRKKFSTFLTGITLITPGTPSTTVLSQPLSDVTIAPFVQEILALHTASDIFTFNGMFNISVFSDDVMVDPSILTWDPTTLTVGFTVSRVSNIYRIVISEATDLSYLNPKWFPTLLKYRYYFPLTIECNLAQLAGQGYYTIASDHGLVQLINKCRLRGQLDPIIFQMIKNGDASGQAYQFTQTSCQFADYLCNTPSLLAQVNAQGGTLFDKFIALCISKGLTTASAAPQMYLMTPRGYPYGVSQGGFAKFQLPLRVMNVTLDATKS